MSSYWLTLGVLAVWRLTHLLSAEDGPWDVVFHLRRWAGESMWGRALDCFNCLSMWIALPFAVGVGETWKERLLLWPALSGGAVLLQLLSRRHAKDKET
jgi:hypothetical protein